MKSFDTFCIIKIGLAPILLCDFYLHMHKILKTSEFFPKRGRGWVRKIILFPWGGVEGLFCFTGGGVGVGGDWGSEA